MTFSLHHFCNWLGNTTVSNTLQDVSWIIPLTQTVHIVCIALLIASAAMLDLRVVGVVGRGASISGASKRLLPWIWGTLPVLLVTGLILTVAEPSRELENPTFVLKMVLLCCAIIVTGGFQAAMRHHPDIWESSPTGVRLGKVLAVLSLGLFISIIVAGRFIAYTDHP